MHGSVIQLVNYVAVLWHHSLYYASIALTKLDVMDSFEEVKIGISYLLDGKELENYPADQIQLHKVTVKYLTLPGWQAATVGITKFEELPVNAQSYVLKLEELISTKS